MIFDSTERATMSALADVLIPAGDGCLSASEAGVSGHGIDQVLVICPELAAPLKQVLQLARGRAPVEVVTDLQTTDPATFAVLAETVAGAYFMNAQVRVAIGYGGEGSRPIRPKP